MPKKQTLAETATQTLRQAILDLSLEPGSRIDERILAQRFDISRTPAREALNRLVAEGLVIIEPNQGARVLPLDLREIRAFFDAYFAQEKMLAFFCQFDDAGLVEDLERLNDELHQAQRQLDVDGIESLNSAFHLRIAQSCHNVHLMAFAQQMLHHSGRFSYYVYRMERSMRMGVEDEHIKVQDQHKQIIEAIRQRDRVRLNQAMTIHARQFYDRAVRVLSGCTGEQFSLGDDDLP